MKNNLPYLTAYRWGLSFTLLAFYVKCFFIVPHFLGNHKFPIGNFGVFPGVLSSSYVALVIYLVPVLSAVGLFMKSPKAHVIAAGLVSFCSLFLMLHLDSYNDATFNTCFWVGLWLLFLPLCHQRVALTKIKLTVCLGQCLVCMVFLGGFVGKLTPEYWSGEVLYDIYFTYRNYFPYEQIKEAYSENEVRTLAKYFSWAVIACEGLMSVSVLLPMKWFTRIGLVVCSGIVLLSHPYLFSVMGPLIGLICAVRKLDSISQIETAETSA